MIEFFAPTLLLLAVAIVGWLIGRRSGQPRPRRVQDPRVSAAKGARAASSVQRAKLALQGLDAPDRWGVYQGSPASRLRRAQQPNEFLFELVAELVASPKPRDAEAGRVLLDYYVRRVGTHEVVMERLHLSRPTFYRRLSRGLELVAERLDERKQVVVPSRSLRNVVMPVLELMSAAGARDRLHKSMVLAQGVEP